MGNLSFKKLEANVSLKHPRKVKNGKKAKFGICMNTGRLTSIGK
jgi:hypothetical protein